MSQQVLDNLNAAKVLYSQLLILVATVIQNPTQANINAAVDAIHAGTWSGILTPKLSYSIDGESYQWQAFYQTLTSMLKDLNILIQQESMSWCITSRARA
ncbi:MAG TPA: hypothetical protein VKE94_10235 [Gemmataceae bacterium]|nr:hypothetical protein [Gemmataceae bacterium]